jgi:hypothetical protein
MSGLDILVNGRLSLHIVIPGLIRNPVFEGMLPRHQLSLPLFRAYPVGEHDEDTKQQTVVHRLESFGHKTVVSIPA